MTVARYRGQTVFCTDVRATAELYRTSLGFRRDADPAVETDTTDSTDSGDIPLRAEVAGRPGATVEVYLHPAAPGSVPAPADLGTFDVDDVDAALGRLAARGWQVAAAAEDTPWGEREAVVRDHDGHTLTLAGPPASPASHGRTPGA